MTNSPAQPKELASLSDFKTIIVNFIKYYYDITIIENETWYLNKYNQLLSLIYNYYNSKPEEDYRSKEELIFEASLIILKYPVPITFFLRRRRRILKILYNELSEELKENIITELYEKYGEDFAKVLESEKILDLFKIDQIYEMLKTLTLEIMLSIFFQVFKKFCSEEDISAVKKTLTSFIDDFKNIEKGDVPDYYEYYNFMFMTL